MRFSDPPPVERQRNRECACSAQYSVASSPSARSSSSQLRKHIFIPVEQPCICDLAEVFVILLGSGRQEAAESGLVVEEVPLNLSEIRDPAVDRVKVHLPGVRQMLLDRGVHPEQVRACRCDYEAEKRDQQRWAMAGMPIKEPGEVESRFDTFEQRTGTDQAYAAALAFAKQEGPRILTLTGPTGTGKTMLATAALRELLGVGLTGRYEYVPRLLGQLRSAAGNHHDSSGDHVEGIIDRCRHCKVLVLDDLGLENGSEFGVSSLSSIIEDRLTASSRLIVTTNLTHDQLADKHSGAYARIASRLFAVHSGEARVATIVASDYRTGV